MTIREYLKSLGATDAELTAKVVGRMERAMLIDADLETMKPDTVLRIITEAANGLEYVTRQANVLVRQSQEANLVLDRAVKESNRQIDELKRQTAGIKEAKVNNPDTRDAVMAYATVLNATRDIFGAEAMSPDVMIAAINAGSYIAWRGIMGPKDADDKRIGKRVI